MPHVTLVLRNTQEVDLAAVGRDSVGADKPLFGPFVWENSNPAVLDVPAVDAATVIAKTVPDAVGITTVTVHAFADAVNTMPVVGHIDVDVQAEVAVTIDVVAGTPRPRT